MVYSLPTKASTAFPPILVEVQNKVDDKFLHRLVKYASHLYDEYGVDPIVLTFAIHPVPLQVMNKFITSAAAPFLKNSACDGWAKMNFIMDATTIEESLTITPLPPLAALAHVFFEQKASLMELDLHDDPTIMALYEVAKEAFDNQVTKEEETVDALLKTTSYSTRQFEKIISATEQDEVDIACIKQYAADGAKYASAFYTKYQDQGSSLSSSPAPPSSSSSPALPSSSTTDLDWAHRFVTNRKNLGVRMNWAKCFEEGLREGHFTSYANSKSLKAMYHKSLASQKNQ
ncbi:hypothetical protein DM01DRAFT_1340626 [Hesseltinella vesiculosa]|uniref:Uncharacterized protein n=1 Tax=Hesseltinella vesiculosa TaxID=101127 RepID=A0A1X2G3L0_9FUNG|nr:hypothetical protein DM01DRAFT_1340626 [Hesseltinella vesiculosa]